MMRRFELIRSEDATGVSGTGTVAEGVIFGSGRCVVQWRPPHESITVHDSIRSVEAVHLHGGLTRIEWLDRDDGPVLDADGKPIRMGAVVRSISPMSDTEVLHVERVWIDDDTGEGWISAVGWPENGYGLGADRSRKVRVVNGGA